MPTRDSERGAVDLSAYFPRFAVDWARDEPERAWREIDASLVFVDISGFTALSERLARRGHQGAEELTQTLSTCFADLLVAAYADGGSLVKFGGDALFLLFDGDDHAERAARSALQMRARLAKSGRIATSVGAIRLRMSAGVHSGPVHLFRVGESHKELLIAGPGPSSVVSMEQTATAGEIVISAGTAERIAPRLVGDPAGAGFFLHTRPRVSDEISFPLGRAADVDLTLGVPVALRDHLASASVEPEHRQVTVAFIRFDGIDDVIATDGGDAAAAALHELVVDVQDAVDGEGVTFLGTDADRDGGKIIVVGGAPSALDDTEGRVLRAMRRVLDKQRRLPVRIGVNHGHAFVGEVGPSYRRTYTVMGDTVNLAARLMASATQGQLRATGGVLDLAATEFDTTALEPFTVKGKTRPVEAFLVGDPVRRRTRAVTDLPFVGRQHERWTLTNALERMRAGNGGLVDIVGEAGIGKSRLLREMLTEAPELPVVTAYCETYESKTPYFAARFLLRGVLGLKHVTPSSGDVLRALVTEQAPDLLPWLPLIGAVIDVPVPSTPEASSLDPKFVREQTGRVIVELLDAVVPGFQLFVVEDAQWLDDLSAEIITAVAKRAAERRWFVVIVRRKTRGGYQPGDEATARVVVDLLDDDDARELLQSALGDVTLLRPDQVDALVDRAGGNPLFLEQLAQAAKSGADVSTSISDSLESVIAAQIDTLPAPDRRALRVAAVLGPIFESARFDELIAAEGGEPRGAPRRLRAFLEATSPGWLRFRNQCYREVAYETLSFRKRKELHARAGSAIESAAHASGVDRSEMLSFHFLHAGEYEKCWTYSLAAAERATKKYANVEAVSLYERAVAAGSQLGAEFNAAIAKTYGDMGRIAMWCGMLDRAKSAVGRARALVKENPIELASLCQTEAYIAMNRGRPHSSARWTKKGLQLLDGRSDEKAVEQRAALLVARAEHLQRSNDNRGALPLAERAIAEAEPIGYKKAIAIGGAIADLAQVYLGQPTDLSRMRRALDLWIELDNLMQQAAVLTTLGIVSYWRGQWDEAHDYFVRGRDAYVRSGDLMTAGIGTSNIADILLDQGRGDEVEGLSEAINLWRSVGQAAPVAGALTNIGRAALQRGDVLKAHDVFDQARWAAEDLHIDTTEFDYWIAECMIREGDAADARTLLEHALRSERNSGNMVLAPRLHRGIGFAHLALGDATAARAEFEAAVAAAREQFSPYEVALGLDALLRLGPSEEMAAERDATFARLGVRATFPPIPLASVEGVAHDDGGFPA